MTRSRLKVCSEPGCPTLTPHRSRRCPVHLKGDRAAVDARRPNATERGYGRKWAENARAFLDRFPACVDCGDDATVADHSPVTRAELIRRGEPRPDDWQHLEGRCTPCNASKTAAEDGAFGNPSKYPTASEDRRR